MALRKQDIFGFRLDTLHRNVHISWRISGGRMRGILDPAAGAVNKNSNIKTATRKTTESDFHCNFARSAFDLLQPEDVGSASFQSVDDSGALV